MKKEYVFFLWLLLYVNFSCQVDNSTSLQERYLKVTTYNGLHGDKIYIRYYDNENIVKEVKYANNGLQVLDSILYVYENNILILKKSYSIEQDSVYCKITKYEYFSDGSLMSEITFAEDNQILNNILYWYDENTIIEIVKFNNNYISDLIIKEDSVKIQSTYKSLESNWFDFTSLNKSVLNPYIDSVVKSNNYTYYMTLDKILLEYPSGVLDTVLDDVISQKFIFEKREGDYYHDMTSPYLDSAELQYKEYKLIYEILYFDNKEIKELFYSYNDVNNIIAIEMLRNRNGEKKIVRRFEYEYVKRNDL